MSPDFRHHAVSYFFEPILAAHDTDQVEIFCYAEVPHPDEVTTRLQGHSHHWRSTVGLTDKAAAQKIYDDKIDILIDLAGHTANSRLRVFTFKPAPIQCTYLGYFTTTGLASMDYWITDEVLHPKDTPELSTETLYRLPRCSLSYYPPRDAPSISEQNRPTTLTFGSFNHLSKLTPRTVKLWSDVLHAVPDSQLILKTKQLNDESARNKIQRFFADYGIDKGRLTLRGHTVKYSDHLDTYNEVDIALDVLPRTGGSTTADALWMGVPVLTLAGQRYIERLSATMLTALNLDELITETEEEYIGRAVELAREPGRRNELRATLRERMASSPLCDARGLAEALETAYRDMWENRLDVSK